MKRASRRIRNDRVVVCSAVIIEKLLVWRGIRGCSHSSNECNIADTREEAEGIEGDKSNAVSDDSSRRASENVGLIQKKKKKRKMRKETNEPMNEIPHGDIHANFFPQLTPH